MLFISSLNSGSNGNCYYVGNQNEAVLIDAGISCRETERRMARCGLSMGKVKAIIISHEHTDHIRGVEVLSRKYRLPVYITNGTLHKSRLRVDDSLTRSFSAPEPIVIGGLEIVPFPKQHDASDPHSFVVRGEGVTVGVFTDIGAVCGHVVRHFASCDAAFLESNYDDAMLENGHYPYHLKKRIRSEKGHLSNEQALQLFLQHGSRLTCLLLSHLSRDNNDPGLVHELFSRHAGKTTIAVASRYEESAVYAIQKQDVNNTPAPMNGVQMSLFT
jgi:phosphoribosyl 1,2-cyclic phosphodiesterase